MILLGQAFDVEICEAACVGKVWKERPHDYQIQPELGRGNLLTSRKVQMWALGITHKVQIT